MPAPYYQALKTMGVPGPPQSLRPNIYSPYSYLLGVVPSAGGDIPSENAFVRVPGDSGLYAQKWIYDPTDYVVKADGTPFPKGTITVLSGQTVYKATDSEQIAAVGISFETVTAFGDQAIQFYYDDQNGSGYTTATYYHAGELYPAGTATNYDEQSFFPSSGPPLGFDPDIRPRLSNSVYGPVGTNPALTAPGPYYSNCTLDTVIAYPHPDASGNYTTGWIYFPPRPLDYDIWAPAGRYLVGHIRFPGGSYFAAEMQQRNFFTLSSLYIMRDAAPPYVTRQNDIFSLPTVIALERGIAGQPGGGTGAQPSITPALLGHPSRHYNRAATLMQGAQALGVRFWRSNRAIPLLSGPAPTGSVWDTGRVPGGAVGISNVVGDNAPSLAEDARGLLYCLFNRPTQGAMLSRSYDDGDTWGTPALAISGGTHPAIASSEGRTLCAAVTTTGTSPSFVRHITAVYRGPGDRLFSNPYTFQYRAVGGGLTALSVADDSFGLVFTDEGAGRIGLHVLLATESATSDWWSADNGETWTRIPIS